MMLCGAGAIGGFFGGHLIKAGADVSFLVRAKRQKNLKKFGLRVLSAQGDFKVIPKFFNKEIESKTFDLIILTNKSYDLDATIRDIKPHAKNAVILPTLNGIAHFFKLDEAFGKKNVFGGFLPCLTSDSDSSRVSASVHPVFVEKYPFWTTLGQKGKRKACRQLRLIKLYSLKQ